MNFNEGLRALDGFFLGAAMQSDPFLEGMEDYGVLADSDDDCVSESDEDCPDTEEEKPQEEEAEQMYLFGMDEPDVHSAKEPKKKPAPKRKEEPPKPSPPPQEVVDVPLEKKLTFKDYLDIFCGNQMAANYWWCKHHKRST